MPPRKRAKKKPTGRGRCLSTKDAPEEPVPTVPAASPESEAESTAPPPAFQVDIVSQGHQPAAQSSSDSDDEVPPSEAVQSQAKRRRALVTADFTDQQEQDMVDWLQSPEQQCLLDKKHPNYIKKGLKDALWDQKAREIGKTSDQLKKWYANMRSRFGKLKQTPSGSGNIELTARDRWILQHFEFIRPHLILQVKKRVTVSMKAKVQARAAPAAAVEAPPSESDVAVHHPPAVAPSDPDTSMGPRATDDTETTRSNIAELQRQLLNKLSKAEKSPMQRQKDTFADFMKEVTYTFTPPIWLRFQNEVNTLLQKYQLELQQQPPMPPMQTQQQQQQRVFNRPYPPATIPGPSGSQQCLSVGWQPHPSQWPAHIYQPTSVWGSQEPNWLQQQAQQSPIRPQTSTPLLQPPSTATQSKDSENENFACLSGFSSGSYSSLTQLLNSNQAEDNAELNTPRPAVQSPTPSQQSEQSEQQEHMGQEY